MSTIQYLESRYEKAHQEARGSFVQNKHWISSALFVESFYQSAPL